MLSRHRVYLFITAILAAVSFSSTAIALEHESSNWNAIETRYTIIRYQSESDLKRLLRQIDYSKRENIFRLLFRSKGSAELRESISNKVDSIFERVQEILDMRNRLRKVTINIYKDRNQLKRVYSQNYNGPCRFRAWYWHKNNTIYININDVHEGILAHELAHAIVYNYLTVRPPRATAEILARYVDSHLKK